MSPSALLVLGSTLRASGGATWTGATESGPFRSNGLAPATGAEIPMASAASAMAVARCLADWRVM
jgi:hypothetical protein